ncbi:MAG: ribose 5-phosphate isomerase A [Chloroflexi bacterium RBG_19FT_COMBO_55_16]|nr:MAG: ribose 5-phosphate isomerase A [Chloroflexi bacterium RBG_19FT_COMBO_55_16]
MDLKRQAATYALDYVKDGMLLGLGSGSTSSIFIELLGERLQAGALNDIRGVPTSQETARLARQLGIPLVTLAECGDTPVLDLAVDGADEVDPQLNLIKGLGRAALREKIVEIHARRFLVIGDASKAVPRLGQGPLPVEIVTFESEVHVRWLNSLGCRAELWRAADSSPVVTDNGNYLVRCWFEGGIPDAYALARTLADRPGIVEHGLFLDMADEVALAGGTGMQIMERK